ALEDRVVPSTFTVVNLNDGGPGSLRQAVLDANALTGADTIAFAHGLTGAIPLTSGQLSITDSLAIDGPGAYRLAVSGNLQSRVFSISGGVTVTIARLTITDGRVIGGTGGGGILNTGSTLTLANDVLSNNQALGVPGAPIQAGAIGNVASSFLTVSYSTFINNQVIGSAGSGNTGSWRAAPLSTGGSTAMISHGTFIGNQAIGGDGDGDGGFARAGAIGGAGTLTIEDSTFTGNRAIGGNGHVGASG